MWSFLCDSLATFETKYGIDALAITTHACTAGLVGADELVLPMLDYEYEIPPEIAAEYDDLRPAFEKTFSPRMPGGLNLGAQLHFLRSTFPKEYASAALYLTFPQYWSWRLTGVARSERTFLGCHSDLWLPKQGTYSSLVGAEFPKKLFAPMSLAGDTAPVNEIAAKATRPKTGHARDKRHPRFQCFTSALAGYRWGDVGGVFGNMGDFDVGWRDFGPFGFCARHAGQC